MHVTITLTDKVDGKVEIITSPDMATILNAIANRSEKAVPPSFMYATRAATAMMKLGEEAREENSKSKIITTLPRLRG